MILKRVGIVKEMKDPIAPTEKMASMATPPNINKQSKQPMNQFIQTALTGVRVVLLTVAQ